LNIGILGATSAIAQETARCFARDGASFFLVGRDSEKLRIVAEDLRARGAPSVTTLIADLAEFSRHAAIAAGAPSLDVVLIAHGVLNSVDAPPEMQVKAFELNATSFISLSEHFKTKTKILVLIGSVAGDRGRPTNYVYGAAKSAVETYCEGLQAGGNVRVVLVKPGWIDTPMTSGMRKNFLFATAAAAGKQIHDAILKRRSVVYVPGFWRWVSLVVRLLPARFVRF
jgi:short-subunit dehydrogenase